MHGCLQLDVYQGKIYYLESTIQRDQFHCCSYHSIYQSSFYFDNFQSRICATQLGRKLLNQFILKPLWLSYNSCSLKQTSRLQDWLLATQELIESSDKSTKPIANRRVRSVPFQIHPKNFQFGLNTAISSNTAEQTFIQTTS